MKVLTEFDYEFFRQYGFVVCQDLVSAAEVGELNALFDADRAKVPLRWQQRGDQAGNYDALVTTPEFDAIVRHPSILEAAEDLMGGPLCFGEIGIRHMGAYEGDTRQGFHRDQPHWTGHPLRMDYIQFMLYLTDVDETTHCFSISPESVDEPILERQAQLDRHGSMDIHGPAGTVCLFNVSVLHTATTRATQQERRSVQIYYGHRGRPYLADDSLIPPVFWSDPDPEVRAFYGNVNEITRIYLNAFGLEEPVDTGNR